MRDSHGDPSGNDSIAFLPISLVWAVYVRLFLAFVLIVLLADFTYRAVRLFMSTMPSSNMGLSEGIISMLRVG